MTASIQPSGLAWPERHGEAAGPPDYVTSEPWFTYVMRSVWRSQILILLIVVAGCSSRGPTPTEVAAMTPSTSTCPLNPSIPGHDLSPDFGYGAAFGEGPVYGIPDGGLLDATNGWRLGKILWIADPKVSGPVSITGRELHDTEVAWRAGGDEVLSRLEWSALHDAPSKWSSLRSDVLVQTAGCFRFAVSAPGVRETIYIPLGTGP